VVIGRKVLVDRQRRRERRDRDEIGRRELVVDVVVRSLDGAVDFLGLHRAEIEEQYDETAPAHVDLRRRQRRGGGRRFRGRLLRQDRRRLGRGRDRRVGRVELLEVERRDRLRLVVFRDGEVVARQAAHDR